MLSTLAEVLRDIFIVLGVMAAYRHQSSGKSVTVASYTEAKGTLDAIYASGRLQLPFEGLLLFGWAAGPTPLVFRTRKIRGDPR